MKMNADRVNITFITPSFSKGGAEKNILNIINILDENLFDIHLIICGNETGYLSQLNKEIKIYILNKGNVQRSLLKIASLLRSLKPQIVFNSALHLSICLLFIKRFSFYRFKLVCRIPSLPSNRLDKNSFKDRIVNFFLRSALSVADRIIAQTPKMKQEILSYYKSPSYKVEVIPNPVDTHTIESLAKEYVDLPNNFFYYVAAGTLYSVKGFDLLIRAFSEILNEYPQSRLLILGSIGIEKEYKIYLERLILDLKLEGNVFLLGHQDNPYKYFKFANAFVLSSIKEGFPNVVLENLVLKKPVVVTDCVDFTGIINKGNGVVVGKESVSELVRGMKSVRKLESACTSIEVFDFDTWFKQVLK